MSLILQSSGGGSVTINEPATASNFTQTLPASAGTVMVSGNMPAFSAYQSSAQTLSSSTDTKLTFTTEEFDTNNNFTSSTFTPTVAGYYLVNAAFQASSAYTTGVCAIRKNGSNYKNGAQNNGAAIGQSNGWSVSSLVFCNGSTDYIEIYGTLANGQALAVGIASTYFNAVMVRGA